MKAKILGVVAVIVFSLVVLSPIAFAHGGHQGGSHDQPDGEFTVSQGETVEGSYYAAGKKVTIEGTVNGDVYCAAEKVMVTGTINGDLICAAQAVMINSTIAGDARVAAQYVTFEGETAGAVSVFAQTIEVRESARIGKDLNGAAQVATINGSVERDVFMASSELTLGGEVGRNIGGGYEQLTVSPGASVAGDVRYTSQNEAVVADGTVLGQTEQTQPPVSEDDDSGAETLFGAAAYTFISLLLISLVVSLIAPQLVHAMSERGSRQLLQSILVGFFVVFATPLVAILLAITVIGIPLAGALILAWLLTLVLSGPVFGYLLGRRVMQARTASPVLIMLVGASILLLSYFIPIANIFTVLAAGVIGSGMIVTELARRYKKPQYKVKG